jgi:hypothetical protein
MLFAGAVILFNICSASITHFSEVQIENHSHYSKKDLVLKQYAQAESPDQLIDIEENNLEVEEKEERSESKTFFFLSGFCSSGSYLFEELNGHENVDSFFSTQLSLPLFILFENFRI